MSMRRPVTAVTLGFGIALAVPFLASAHHTTVTCQSPGVWLIANSETDKTMTFTTDQGHAGSIGANDDGAGPNGQTTVAYSGTSLTVSGVWDNGVTNTNTGTGDCTSTATTTTEAPSTTTASTVPASTSTTTTTIPASTTPATTTPTTTTIPASTTPATTTPTTTEPTTTTSSSVVTSSTPSTSTSPTTSVPGTPTTAPPSSEVSSTSSTVPGNLCADGSTPPCAPPTTQPECVDNPNTPQDDCAPICVPVTLKDGSNSCSPPLPATGSNTVGIIIAAWIAILAGIVALGYGAAHRER